MKLILFLGGCLIKVFGGLLLISMVFSQKPREMKTINYVMATIITLGVIYLVCYSIYDSYIALKQTGL